MTETKTFNPSINEEMANKELERFMDTMGLDYDTEDLDVEDLKDFENKKKRLIKAICKRDLVINEKGEPVYTPKRGDYKDPLTFYEPSGRTMLAFDKRSNKEQVGQSYELLASITKTHAALFTKMNLSDLKICHTIASLFLAELT